MGGAARGIGNPEGAGCRPGCIRLGAAESAYIARVTPRDVGDLLAVGRPGRIQGNTTLRHRNDLASAGRGVA